MQRERVMHNAACPRGNDIARSSEEEVLPRNALVDRRYRILDVIAFGRTYVVYRAQQVNAENRLVAVKILRSSMLSFTDVMERHERELRALAQLRSTSSIRLIDAGRLAGGCPYLVTELLQGFSLALALTAGPLSLKRTFSILKDLCAALVEAHERGIIHGALTTRSIFLDQIAGHERIKLLDLGSGRQELSAPTALDVEAIGRVGRACLTGIDPTAGSAPRGSQSSSRSPRSSCIEDREMRARLTQIIDRIADRSPRARTITAKNILEQLQALEGTAAQAPPKPRPSWAWMFTPAFS